jgi:hypothetical protein
MFSHQLQMTVGAVGLLALAGTARAETIWDDPGVAPFGGSLSEMVMELSRCGAPYAALAQLAWQAERGVCAETEIYDGERYDLMLSRNGCMRQVVARIGPRWHGKSLRQTECRDAEGHRLLIPEACGNGSYVYAPPILPLPVPVMVPGGAWLPGAVGEAGEFFGPTALPGGGEVAASPESGPVLQPVVTPTGGGSTPLSQPSQTPIKIPEPDGSLAILASVATVALIRRYRACEDTR